MTLSQTQISESPDSLAGGVPGGSSLVAASPGPVGSVLVVGAGISGMQAALDLADSGYSVLLTDAATAIGGVMSSLDKTFPTNDCAMCIMSPKLVDAGRHLDISIMAGTELVELTGEPGHFQAKLRVMARSVDMSTCTACGDCTAACPVELPSPYDFGLAPRKAISKLYPQAVPNSYAVEKRGVSPCREACPSGVNVQGLVALTGAGSYAAAWELIREALPFPIVCGTVCHRPCEVACQRGDYDEPVAVARLKRFLGDHAMANPEIEAAAAGRVTALPADAPAQVAIIGSGPAGLAAAYHLARDGIKAVVFEALPVPGGMMRVGIPTYRLPRELVEHEIKLISDLGVEIRCGQALGRDFTVDDLFADGYQAVLVAVGAHRPQRTAVAGDKLPSVLQGVDFLRAVSLDQPTEIGPDVLVVGGGNTAVDAARTALRVGASRVQLLYRRTAAEMTAMPHEIEEALEEGIKVHYLVSPVAVLEDGSQGCAAGLSCVLNELGEPDAGGRRRPVAVKGSEFELKADTVIFATGQQPETAGFDGKGFGLSLGWGGTVSADPLTLATNREGVFAAGDAVTGPAMLIDAAGAGRRAAESIRRYLWGEDMSVGRRLVPEPHAIPRLPLDTGPRHLVPRQREIKLDPTARRKVFTEVLQPLADQEAVAEALRCLSCGGCAECMQCVSACAPKCIDHSQVDEFVTVDVGAVILAPGGTPANAALRPEFGYGVHPNVVTSVEFERMLSASGPFQGEVLRPSDGGHPSRIAFIQCVGSRELSGRAPSGPERHAALATAAGPFLAPPQDRCGEEYCSSVCCMYTAKEAVIAQEHVPGLKATVFYMDVRSFGKEFDRYIERAQTEYGIRYVRSMVSTVRELSGSSNLLVRYQSPDGRFAEEEFDLVVLAVGLRPPASAVAMAGRIGVAVNEYGFAETHEFAPAATTRPGVFVCGTFAEPKDIPESVTEGSAAAAAASRLLSAARGTLTRQREYPPERDVSREAPRVGVIVCQCGLNIASVIDTQAVAQWAARLPGVVWAESFLYSCSQDSIERLKDVVLEHQLNRVVVASCTPRTHESLFRETIRQAGLNPYLFEMANIREQSSWVHRDYPAAATSKAKDLVAAAVAKARLLRPVEVGLFEVNQRALVVGGGASGMTAALSLAEQGFEVCLVEREAELGGNLRHLYTAQDGKDPQAFLRDLVARVKGQALIRVMCDCEVTSSDGYVGNYQTTIRSRRVNGGDVHDETIEHGVAVIATGALEGEAPPEYLHGRHPSVVTQVELDAMLAKGANELFGKGRQPKVVAMIQCAGSRTPERPYCSRVCCVQAVRSALEIKARNPATQLYVFYRDLRTYGFSEREYRRAREAGVIFIPYVPEAPPRLVAGAAEGDPLRLVASDPLMAGLSLEVQPDLVVLAAPIVPDISTTLAQAFKLPLSMDGFLLEAHMKLRPVDFATDGVFLCGLAHSPKPLGASLAQAQAASIRAGALLSAKQLESKGNAARVIDRLCRGCGICVDICTYGARVLDESSGVAKVLQVLCQGCGACVAACPSGACDQDGFTKKQIAAMLEAVLGFETLTVSAGPGSEQTSLADHGREVAGQ